MTPKQRLEHQAAETRAAIAAGGSLVVGNAIEVTKESQMSRVYANTNPGTENLDVQRIQAVAKILGVEPDDIDGLKRAFTALIDPSSPESIEATARRFGLSASETENLVVTRGNVHTYVALKRERAEARAAITPRKR
jgi:hypothetical protein